MDHIEPRVHDEIKDYREKFYNFTLRQWIFGILIVLTTVPLYLVLSPKIGSDLTGWIVIVIAIPIGFFGFIPVQGLPAEKIIFYWKRNYINFSKPIVYKSEEDLLREKQNKKQSSKNISINKKELKNQKKQETATEFSKIRVRYVKSDDETVIKKPLPQTGNYTTMIVLVSTIVIAIFAISRIYFFKKLK